MTVVSCGFPVPGAGAVDVLALDMLARPVLILVDRELDAAALCRGFVAADWVARHLDIVAHMYPGESPKGDVRVWHAAQEVTLEARAIARRVGSAAPELFAWRGVSIAGERWIVVQPERRAPAAQPDAAERRPEPRPAGAQSAHEPTELVFQSMLSESEIEGILGGRDGFEEDEVTSRTRLPM